MDGAKLTSAPILRHSPSGAEVFRPKAPYRYLKGSSGYRTWLPVVMPVASIKFPVLSPDITSGRPSYKRLLCCDAGDQPEYEY